MKVMLLCAGRGERMGELTAQLPKPLLPVRNTTLVAHNLQCLRQAEFSEVIINVHYQHEKIMMALGDGQAFGLRIRYSIETERLNTGGGIQQALPLLGEQPFLVLSGDIWTDYPLIQLRKQPVIGGHLVMVNNPIYHPAGDFHLNDVHQIDDREPRLTYGNIAVLHPALFFGETQSAYPLSHIFKKAMAQKTLTGEHYQGFWANIGTPSDLAALQNNRLNQR